MRERTSSDSNIDVLSVEGKDFLICPACLMAGLNSYFGVLAGVNRPEAALV